MRVTYTALVCTTLACLLSTDGPCAPVVKVLETFEGELTGWSAPAVSDDSAPEGSRVLRWVPPAKPGPQFTYFDYSDRGVEADQWDRLIFDYRFDKPGCNWWGIKLVDHPLGDGMQATWLVGNGPDITPGRWQTAVLNLRSPNWLWGDRPDKNSQAIHFRAQFDKGASCPILIDNIRFERDAIRIEALQAADPVREGDALSVLYTATVANRSPEPVTVGIGLRDLDGRLRATLQSDELTIPGESTRDTSIRLATRLAGPDAPIPLDRLSAQLSVHVLDSNEPESTGTMSLAIPLEQVQHPCLLITRQQAHEVLAKLDTDDNAKSIYTTLERRADDWLERTPEFPDRGGQWWHWYACKKCGSRLQTQSPTKHVCPDCGEVYSGWPYDDVVLDRQHNALGRAIRDLGLMYTFTGDARYATKAREILLGYAERYLGYPLHNIHGEAKKGGGHVGPQTLDESTWLIPVVQGFDCIYDTLTEQDIAQIADKLLVPAAELIHDHQWGIHNICCWHASAYGLVGIALANEQFAADAINGPKGFRAQVEKGVTDDGFWYESAWGYHFYTMHALEPLAVAARNIGIDLYTERYKSMYDAPLRFMAPGGILPAFNDSGRSNALGSGPMYEIAYARWADARHLLPVLHGSRNSLETLLFGRALGAPEEFVLGSTVFPAAGYALLRSGRPGAGGAFRHVPENYVALDFGPHGGGHGHPDKLSVVLYGAGQLLAEDPGCIAYGNPAHGGWYRQTLSHNTVLVNGKSQKPCTGTLQFRAFAQGIGLCSARADEAYDKVRLRRTIALAGRRVIDIFLCQAQQDTTFEWAFHNRGDLAVALDAQPCDTPEGDGYGWAKQWQRAEAAGDWSAAWRQADGPGVALTQAEAEAPRTVLTAVGMGNPPRVKVPFVLARTTGKQALYCSALQVFETGPAPQLSVTVLPVAGPVDQDEPPVALQVTDGHTRDVLLVNPAGGAMECGQFRLEGEGALLRYEEGLICQMVVVGQSAVSIAGKPVELPTTADD